MIRRILKPLFSAVGIFKDRSSDQTFYFLMIIHDWFAYILDEELTLPQYGSDLKTVIVGRSSDDNLSTKFWINRIYLRDQDLVSLLYRHNLCKVTTTLGYSGGYHRKPLEILIASMLTKDIHFVELEDCGVFKKINSSGTVINALRQNRPKLENMFTILANREDESDCRLINDHGMLSSFTLMMVLCMVRSVLQHIASVESDSTYLELDSLVESTLNDIQGVLTHA